MGPQTILPELASSVRLEGAQYQFGFLTCGHDRMDVIASDIESVQVPFANAAGFTNCSLNRFAVLRSQNQWLGPQLRLVIGPPTVVAWQIGRLITIVKPIYRTSFVSVQPGAITAEGDEICEWSVRVVPHDEGERTGTNEWCS